MSAGLQAVCRPEDAMQMLRGPGVRIWRGRFPQELRETAGTSFSDIPVFRSTTIGARIAPFIFTTAFDEFTTDDFLRDIYNDDYGLVDPDYRDARPRENAKFLSMLFPANRPHRLLDYGGGNGVLAEL